MCKSILALTVKEVNILKDLLRVAESGWFNDEVLPKGIHDVKEAEKIVHKLLVKLDK